MKGDDSDHTSKIVTNISSCKGLELSSPFVFSMKVRSASITSGLHRYTATASIPQWSLLYHSQSHVCNDSELLWSVLCSVQPKSWYPYMIVFVPEIISWSSIASDFARVMFTTPPHICMSLQEVQKACIKVQYRKWKHNPNPCFWSV